MEDFSDQINDLIINSIPEVSTLISAGIMKDGEIKYLGFHGGIPELNIYNCDKMLFDLASVTKVAVTSMLVMKLLDAGRIALEDNLKSLGMDIDNISGLTLRSLITHTSGIGNFPLHLYGRSKSDYLRIISILARDSVMYKKEVYSDINYILLGFVLENIYEKPLDLIAEQELFRPLSLKNTFFNPANHEMTAPTEVDAARGLIHGTVHDEKAYGLGGVAGHAGLFSNVNDILNYFNAFINYKIISRNTFDLMVKPQNEYLGGIFANGWMVKLPRKRHVSESFGYSYFMGDYSDYYTIGHTGFTGTSVCIDYKNKIIAVLLTNRVYPSRSNDSILRFRRLFHNTVFKNLLT
ncbi:serine hydrolase domain-containing protein [Picrophilus oshimae]|uniref:CubicO group peptidase, beta-lactamase class C family n=1 Tax=Picrophilus torridus (strain ATCC 700027 / DSM 9790 / JCM 10055 / NBRC 100828 / KAW 2/3) TaxID=1122961 RepID=A0A8G2L7S1_PICTO|nr:serine hydrolase [Picrophilus oshimae]SMD31407.1 CubicO group peptidase, beta-lactamase class C family [Picrophilus oshimae DSM 9789]